MDKTELKQLDAVTLKTEVEMLRKELFNLSFAKISGQVKDVSQFKKLKKKVAQALTFLQQKELKNANKSNA
ncbi:50S ribosomal protein L29 [Candidatus Dependentiae bacterium]|jgi:ribosomal protein L29|nr:50S ribosomal protein L29 [Candidatus Dependentiae bacterium]